MWDENMEGFYFKKPKYEAADTGDESEPWINLNRELEGQYPHFFSLIELCDYYLNFGSFSLW